jgi:hypothetical protein
LLADPGSDKDRAVLREAQRQTKWARRGTIVGGLSLGATCAVWVVSNWRFPADRVSDPITIVTAVNSGCGITWFTARPPDEIDFGAVDDIEPDWSEVSGAMPADVTVVQATIQGRSGAEVALTGIDIEVRERRRPPSGTALRAMVCGDVGAIRWMTVDLDDDRPRASINYSEAAADLLDAPTEQRRPIQFPYVVSVDDLETFEITATTDGCDCEWVALLHWRSEGRAGTDVIDDNGKPFRTVSIANARTHCDGAGECT